MTEIISRIEQQHITQSVADGKRLDGRSLTDYREIQIEQGVIEKAEGSARVLLGRTEVLVGIKIEVGQPFPDTPNEGVLTVNAELVPLASPTFDPGPPGEDAVELARIVDRGIRESKAIDLEKLCLEPGKKVLVVFVDLYILNHDGNLIDASALAALAALLNTKMPKYEAEKEETKTKKGYVTLPMRKHPITVTFAKINGVLVLDPEIKEEKVMDARLTFSIDEDGNICAIQKGGSKFFTKEKIIEAVKIAKKKGDEIRKKFDG